MLSVSEKYSQNINADSRDMPYRVKLAGSIILDQTKVPKMTLEESVSGNSGISLGTANSASLKLTLRDADVIDYNGMLVEPESGLTLPDGTIEWLPLGKFWVTDYSTSNDYRTLTLNCADGMYHMTDDYVSALTYPTSIRYVVREIVTQAMVDFIEPDEWPDVEVRKPPEKMTLRNAIGYAAGCCGCNARFNRYGKLEFVWYTESGITIGREIQYMDGMTKLNEVPLEVNFNITGKEETYAVTIVSDGNGGVTATPGQSIYEGDTVTLSVNPFTGYELAEISAITDSGIDVTLHLEADGFGYSFVQPDSNVTITASFRTSSEGPFKLTVRAYDNGGISYAVSENEKGYEYFNKNEIVTIFVEPNSGYEIDKLVTTPANITFTNAGTTAGGGTVYEFAMPQSDVTINAYFKDAGVYHSINRSVYTEGFTTTPGYIVIENLTSGGSTYAVGDVIGVTFARAVGHVFDKYTANVEMTQMDSDEFRFTMPNYDVNIVGYFAEENDVSKEGEYSFLQHPSFATPPVNKPYWAVFYEHSTSVGANAKYYLVWFDSWSLVGSSLTINGYYYCKGLNNGSNPHQWDTSTWSGNGGSSVTWSVYYSRRYEGKCLLASNVSLYKGSAIAFQRCDAAIGTVQTSYIVNGVDVREAGAMTYYPCPDSYSTPLPHANWMTLYAPVIYAENGEDDYTKKYTGSTNLFALYFDSVSAEHFTNKERNYYKLKFPSVTIVQLLAGEFSTIVKNIDEECYIIIEDPNYSSTYRNAAGLLGEASCGLYATSVTIDGVFHDNSAMFCDCVSVAMFSLRSIISDAIIINIDDAVVTTENDTIVINSSTIFASASGNSIIIQTQSVDENRETVTVEYTNPLIYKKMIPSISALVKSISYTPAKVKHRGNPALQAGDIVKAPDRHGVYHTVLIMQQTMTFGGGMNSEITCPGQTSKTASFSANGPLTTQIKKEVAASGTELERKMTVNNSLVFTSIYKTISSTEAKIKSVVEWQTVASAAISAVEQKASTNEASIKSLVEWQGKTNKSIANINQRVDANGAKIGLLVKTETSGGYTIRGEIMVEAINGQSKAKISADVLDIIGKKLNIKVDATNIEGTLAAKQINTDGLNVKNAVVDETCTIKGALSGDIIASNVFKDLCGELRFDYNENTDNNTYGAFYTLQLSDAKDTTAISPRVLLSRDNDGGSNIYLAMADDYERGAYIHVDNSTITLKAIGNGGVDNPIHQIMINSETISLYGSTYVNGSIINASDRNAKNSIQNVSDAYGVVFNALRPVLFRYNDGTSGRLHVGFIAQEIDEAREKAGISREDFAAVCIDKNGRWGVRYEEIIPLNTMEIQKLKARMDALERMITNE